MSDKGKEKSADLKEIEKCWNQTCTDFQKHLLACGYDKKVSEEARKKLDASGQKMMTEIKKVCEDGKITQKQLEEATKKYSLPKFEYIKCEPKTDPKGKSDGSGKCKIGPKNLFHEVGIKPDPKKGVKVDYGTLNWTVLTWQ